MNNPLVSVIIPVYNREKYIAESINSILNQTYRNLELIVVDDGSNDSTPAIVKSFIDSRIKLFIRPENKGVSAAFNYGLCKANGKYIARQDSDDISLPFRLERQINFLEKNKDIFICGGLMQVFNTDKKIKLPEFHDELLIALLNNNPIANPTFIARKNIFDLNEFDHNLRYGEDYAFWSNILFSFTAYNLQETLVFYRNHERQLTKEYKQTQFNSDTKIKIALYKKLNYDIEKFSDNRLEEVFFKRQIFSLQDFKFLLNWFDVLLKNNDVLQIFNFKLFQTNINILRREFIYHVFFLNVKPKINRVNRFRIFIKINKNEKYFVLKKKVSNIFHKVYEV